MKKKICVLLAIVFIFSLIDITEAQDAINSQASGIAIDSKGNVIITGQMEVGDKSILFVRKYNGINGNLIWESKFNEFDLNVGKAVVMGSDDTIYVGGVAGEMRQIGEISFPFSDFLIIKYDENGNRIWYKTYNNGFADILMDMGIDNEGYIYATGITIYVDDIFHPKNLTNMDFWTIKIDPNNGNKVGEDILDVTNGDAAIGMDVRGNDVVVVGAVQTQPNVNKFYTIKYDKNLNIQWEREYGTDASASDAVILPNGDIAVTGEENEDIFTILYDSNGNIKNGWPKKVEHEGFDIGWGVAVDKNGNIIVVGFITEGLEEKWYIVKYASNGNVLWKKADIKGKAIRVAVDDDNSIYIAGYEEGNACLRKYASNGNLLWHAKEEAEVELKVDFIWLPENPTRADIIHFYDKSIGANAWHWDFGDGAVSSEKNPFHQYVGLGEYNVTLTAYKNGEQKSLTKKIFIRNAPPSADFEYSPINPMEGQEVAFSAIATDRDGYIVNYTWDFGDGSIAYGKVVKHTYDMHGNYSVVLQVKDNDGDKKKIKKLVIISKAGENMPPIAHFEVKKHAGKGEEVSLDASTSYDPDGEILIYKWDFGDGVVKSYTSPLAFHEWMNEGEYVITLIVEDDEGYQSSYSQTIKIGGIPKIVIELPKEIKLKKNEEKQIKVNITCFNQTLLFVNFSVDGHAIVKPMVSHFNISCGSNKQIPVIVKAPKSGIVKVKAIAKDLERNISIESNESTVKILLEKSIPSFSILALIAAIFIALLFRKNR